jgi:hypothetical protein
MAKPANNRHGIMTRPLEVAAVVETLRRDCGKTLATSVTRTPESYPTIVSHDDLTVAVLLVTDRLRFGTRRSVGSSTPRALCQSPP